jgi:hypothetical protein
MLFGDNGVIVDQAIHTRGLTLTADIYEKALREGILVDFDTYIKKPGAYQMRVAVRDLTTSRIGSASEFVSIPNLDNKQLALSGILMTQESGVSPNLDLTARRFTSGMNVTISARIYNAILDPANATSADCDAGKFVSRGETGADWANSIRRRYEPK